ncbi:MAG: thiamine diphosphokinase [Candidatus Promineifilaceae bacterium]|nr:thiamine diphosphokinase [Candidatus Promineifilaceae bacterium]
MTILIFANGDIEPIDWVRPRLAEATRIISANGGATHLLRLAVQPEVVIGDLDSLPSEARHLWRPPTTRFEQRPTHKDETDLELALLLAAETYSDPIEVYGSIGGRLDQTLANVYLLAHPRLRGRRVTLVEQYQRSRLCADRTTIRGERGDKVSLIPLSDTVQVASTRGLQWPLVDEVLFRGPARGVSNEMLAAKAEVVVTRGSLLCVHTDQAWHR